MQNTNKDIPTLAQAKSMLLHLGIILKYNRDLAEYTVNIQGGREATCYYTDDLQDAIGTGKAMAAHGKAELCRWFLACNNPATTTQAHSILGEVPVCARCKAFAEGK